MPFRKESRENNCCRDDARYILVEQDRAEKAFKNEIITPYEMNLALFIILQR